MGQLEAIVAVVSVRVQELVGLRAKSKMKGAGCSTGDQRLSEWHSSRGSMCAGVELRECEGEATVVSWAGDARRVLR